MDSRLSSPFYSDVGAQEPIKLTGSILSPRSEIIKRVNKAEGPVKNSSAPKEKKRKKLLDEDQSLNPEASRLSSSMTKKISKYSALYSIQHKACELVRNRKRCTDKRQPVREAVAMHTNILNMIRHYEAFNFLDEDIDAK